MKTLYLHIGTRKTATTAIQSFLLSNRGALLARGVDFPVMPFSADDYEREHNGAFLLDAHLSAAPHRRAGRLAAGLDCVTAAFDAADSVVLSGEDLWTVLAHGGDGFLCALAAHAEEHAYAVKVIVYLRRQDELAMSWRNQDVKTGLASAYRTMTWEEWLGAQGECIFDYRAILDRIAAHVGRGNIIVRAYERDALERSGGVLADFCSCIGIRTDGDFDLPARDANSVSLGCDLTEVKRIANIQTCHDPVADALFWQAAILCAVNAPVSVRPGSPATREGEPQVGEPREGGGGPRPAPPRQSLFSPGEARAFLSRFQDGNDAIAREFLHTDAPLFSSAPPADAVKWSPGTPEMTAEAIRFLRVACALQNAQIAGEAPMCRREGREDERVGLAEPPEAVLAICREPQCPAELAGVDAATLERALRRVCDFLAVRQDRLAAASPDAAGDPTAPAAFSVSASPVGPVADAELVACIHALLGLDGADPAAASLLAGSAARAALRRMRLTCRHAADLVARAAGDPARAVDYARRRLSL